MRAKNKWKNLGSYIFKSIWMPMLFPVIFCMYACVSFVYHVIGKTYFYVQLFWWKNQTKIKLIFVMEIPTRVRWHLYIETCACIVQINPILLISQAANPVNLVIHILDQLSLNEPSMLLTSRGSLDQYIIFIWYRMILPSILWTISCEDITLWKLWCWKPNKQDSYQGPFSIYGWTKF